MLSALADHLFAESVVAAVASPVEHPAGVAEMLERIPDGVRRGLTVLRIPRRARQPIEDPK